MLTQHTRRYAWAAVTAVTAVIAVLVDKAGVGDTAYKAVIAPHFNHSSGYRWEDSAPPPLLKQEGGVGSHLSINFMEDVMTGYSVEPSMECDGTYEIWGIGVDTPSGGTIDMLVADSFDSVTAANVFIDSGEADELIYGMPNEEMTTEEYINHIY